MADPDQPKWNRVPGRGEPAAALRYALYVHIPFCRSRCHYCDFNTYAGMDEWVGSYAGAVVQEAGQLARAAADPPVLSSVYLGGGTPSRLSPDHLETLVEGIWGAFRLDPAAELSLEANPGELAPRFLEAARELGFERISLGMQSADERVLRLLGRRHNHAQTAEAVRRIRLAGFGNLNLDLIVGVPGQDLASWRATVDQALGLGPDHLSVYALSVEPGTPLASQIARRRVASPDDDLAADMLDDLDERLAAAGLHQYEISNWARGPIQANGLPASACRHNLTYWRNQPYLALGAGAHGYADAVRTANVRPIVDYIGRIRSARQAARFPISPATETWRSIGADEAARDTMLLGLRLTQAGVDRQDFILRHGQPAWETMQSAAAPLIQDGLLEWGEGSAGLRLSGRGRRLGNRVFQAFV